MKQPKLIICDIDGTLITDQYVFTKQTKKVMERLHQHGVLLGFWKICAINGF